jgi:hypothetical protein
MYRKINIKQLSIVFLALLAVVVLIEWSSSRSGNRTFREDLVKVDAGRISAIEIYPKVTGGEKIRLEKEDEMWWAESADKKFPADPTIANSMIDELNRVKPESVVGVNKDRWEQYEVTDSLGTRVKLFSGNDLLADLVIGKFSFSQPRKMTSYVRLTGENEVYGVDGMLGMTFNRNLNAFRNKRVISSNSSDWTKLVFHYPADSSFVLQKAGSSWSVGELPADSAAVANYFSAVSNLSEGSFADNHLTSQPSHQLTIEGNNSMESIVIKGYFLSDDEFIIESSQNPGNYFDSRELAEKIFISSSGLGKVEN